MTQVALCRQTSRQVTLRLPRLFKVHVSRFCCWLLQRQSQCFRKQHLSADVVELAVRICAIQPPFIPNSSGRRDLVPAMVQARTADKSEL